MAKDWMALKSEIEAETKRIWLEEPLELKKLRLGIIDNEAGSYGQYFTTLDFAVGMMRDLPSYTLYQILRLTIRDDFTLEHGKAMFAAIDPPYTSYLGYSGYRTLERFGKEFLEAFPSIQAKEDFIELLKAYTMYCNKLNAWSYHYYPYGIGVMFPHSRAREIVEISGKEV